MNDDDALDAVVQEAGVEYVATLEAVRESLRECDVVGAETRDVAPVLVQALARRGYLIEKP